MSWSMLAMRLPAGIRSTAELPSDFAPPPIGPRADIVAAITRVAPDADFSNPSLGFIDTPGAGIEIGLGEADPVDCLAVRVVGGGDEVVPLLADLLAAVGVQGLDFDTESGLFSVEESRRSFGAWQEYRDRVIEDRTAGDA